MSLFGSSNGEVVEINLPTIPSIDEWDDREKLQEEKETLGFYVTGHPLDRFKSIMDKFTTADALGIKEVDDKSAVRIGGTISSVKVIRTRKEELMAFATVEDILGSVEVVVFPSIYTECADLLTEDTAVLVQGQVQVEDNGVKILADTVIPMEQAEETWTVEIRLKVNAEASNRETLTRVHQALKRYPGTCKGYLHISINDQAEAVVAMTEELRIRYCGAMTREVNSILGYNAVETQCIDAAGAMRKNDLNGKRKNRNGHRFSRH